MKSPSDLQSRCPGNMNPLAVKFVGALSKRLSKHPCNNREDQLPGGSHGLPSVSIRPNIINFSTSAYHTYRYNSFSRIPQTQGQDRHRFACNIPGLSKSSYRGLYTSLLVVGVRRMRAVRISAK